MRASSLKWSIIPILLCVYNFQVDPQWDYPSEWKTRWTLAWLCLIPVMGLMTTRSLVLAFKKHYDLTPTVGSRIVNVLSKVLSIVSALVVAPLVMLFVFGVFAFLTLLIAKPFL